MYLQASLKYKNVLAKLELDYTHLLKILVKNRRFSVLSDILVKNELCIPLERGSNVLSTGEGFICTSPPSKLKLAVLFCSIYKKCYSVLSDFHPMANDDYVTGLGEFSAILF